MAECSCGEKFRDAEDYRDHLPCPGSELEQMKARVAYLEQSREKLIDDALTNLRVHLGKGLNLDPEDLPGIEASIISLAVEARSFRRRHEDARAIVQRLITRPNTRLTADECRDLAKLAELFGVAT